MIFHAIGLMSGTSLDGLDICYSSFEKKGDGWDFKILKSETTAYPPEWEEKLRSAMAMEAPDLFALNAEYGHYLGLEVQRFIQKHQITALDVIGSHGHTVFHQPRRKFTVQIGDGRAIKNINKIPVVYDFRSGDVLLDGNGAPLVPIGDRLLFSEYDACLNLGGFSNISMEQHGRRIAFDICPVNIVLNQFAGKLGYKYDSGGELAISGNVSLKLLKELDDLDFYCLPPPKSLGMEWVSGEILPLLQDLKPEDVLATFTKHAAGQIAAVLSEYKLKTVLVTGGGAYNTYLLDQVRQKSSCTVIKPEDEVIDFKEALIFAFMAVLRLKGETNVLSSATGSSHDHCSGLLV